MTEYIPNLDPELLHTVAEELQRKEAMQRKHYFILEQLQSMQQSLPAIHQHRVSHEQLCQLANALLDGTVFQIVREMREMQHNEEKVLHERRHELEAEMRRERSELESQQKAQLESAGNRPHEVRRLRQLHQQQTQEEVRQQADRLKKFDMKIIMELDQRVLNQQGMLEKAGLPAFFVTNGPDHIKTQIILLDFIMRLSQKQMPT